MNTDAHRDTAVSAVPRVPNMKLQKLIKSLRVGNTTHGRDARVTNPICVHLCSSVAISIIAITCLTNATALAEHYQIELTVTTPREKARASADTSPPPEGRHPRPVCQARKGEPLVLQFFMTSNFPHEAIKDVTVHYFVTRIEKVGQTQVPSPSSDSIINGHFVMDFKPDTGKVGLRQQFHIDEPGIYLVRVQSEEHDADHEHFSAIDLVVE